MPKSDKRQSILKAAESIFRTRRFHEVTLDDVAAQARVGKGTIYRYFRDKEDLFFQMAADGLEDLRGRLMTASASSLPLRGKLIAIASEMSAMFRQRHRMLQVMFSEDYARRNPGAREVLQQHRNSVSEIIQRVLRQAVEQGELRADLDIGLLECVLFGAIHSRDARFVHEGTDFPIEAVIDLFLGGALPRPTDH